MKRVICLLLVFLTLFSITACSGNKEEPGETNNSSLVEEESNPTESQNSDSNSTNKNNDNVKTAQVPGKMIFVDYDSSLRKKDEASTVLMTDGSMECLIGLAYKFNGGYTGTLEGVIDEFKKSFVNDASSSSTGNLYGSEIVVNSKEKVKIGGNESVKFTGMAKNDGEWDCYVYGYTFIIEDIPCAVIGIVTAKSQDAELISKINSYVEQTAATIRTSK